MRLEEPPFMTVRGLSRRTLLLLTLAQAGALAGCGGGGEPASYALLRYNYLPVLKLKVAAISIQNDWQPGGDAEHLESLSPETPVAALRQMAQDRLGAYGTSGRAVFVIEDASLTRSNGELDGSFAVRLDVYSSDDTRSGFAEARVTQSMPAPSGHGEALRHALYDLTRSLMNSMNVEFEYQLRRSLGDWLVEGSAAPAPIQAQPLPAPGTSSTPAPAPAAPAPAPSSSSAAPATPQGGTPQGGILGTLPLGPAPTTPTP
jgi:hypothetical protein